MKIELVPIGSIKPFDRNPKKHPQRQIDKVAKSIARFGFVQPLVVDADMVLIIGHCRLLAAQQIDVEVVPVLRMEGLTPSEVTALRIADNKLNESDWDMAEVIAQGRELDEELQRLTGFDPRIFLEKDDKDDSAPALPIQAVSKPGDLYEMGPHRLLVGDSTKEKDVEHLMNDHKADMVFTDPPYNVDYHAQGKKVGPDGIMNDKMSPDAFQAFLTDVCSSLKNFTKEGAGLYVFHSSSTQAQFQEAIEQAGMEIKAQLIWNKPSAALGWGDYRWKHEPFFYCAHKDQKAQFYGDRSHETVWDQCETEEDLAEWAKRQKRLEKTGRGTVWTMDRDNVNEYVHPTQKPVELAERAIKNSSKAGDLVLDLFLGSGTTLIASEKTKRVCYGMEMDPRYADVIVQRYMEYMGGASVKLNGEEVSF